MRHALCALASRAVDQPIRTAQARQAAAEALIDLVTAAAAAPCRAAVVEALTVTHGRGPASVWFTGWTAAPAAAGMANAMLAAALDLDDGHRPSRGHPGACVIPAVLAEADRLDATGKPPDDAAILDAIVTGYEVGLRIASARGFYARTGFWGGFAAAAGAGALAELPAGKFAHALAIAGETAPHMVTTTAPPAWPQPVGSDVKEGIPWAVSGGLTAVHLAAAEFTGPLDLVDHAPFFDAAAIIADQPRPLIMETYTKFHAACRHVHAPVEALAALMADHGLTIEQIETIEVRAYSGALRISNLARPQNLTEAQYSIPYCLGLTALRGPSALLPMTAADLGISAAERLAARVTLLVDPALEKRFPAETPVVLRVMTSQGVYQSPATCPSGEADCRPSLRDRLEKFRAAAGASLNLVQAARLEEAIADTADGDLGSLRRAIGSLDE